MEVERKSKLVSMLVWLSVTLFYCYQYVLRALPNIIMPDIMGKYTVGAAEFGSFSGIYYIGYIVVHIPIGLLLSRFGGKLVLPICIALTALGLAPLVYLDSWGSVIIGRAFTGIGSSAAIVGALQIFRIIYPDKFARMLGFTVFFGLITIVYIGNILTGIIKTVGIDSTISILFYTGVILAVTTYILMPKSVEEVSHSNVWTDVKAVIFNPQLIFTSLFAGFMVGPLEGFADAWGSAFMVAVYGIEKAAADYFTLSMYSGMCIGCIILPYIADKTRLHIGITIFSGLVMILCFTYLLSGYANNHILYYVCLVTGIFCAYQVVIISKIATFVSEERSGMAAAVANMIIMSFGSVFHKSIGENLDRLWNGDMVDGIKIYSKEAFISSISIIPIAILIAIIGLVAIIMSNLVKARIIQKKGA
ncbi:MAG: MFS transporter [Rickettsiaceae bacterium]